MCSGHVHYFDRMHLSWQMGCGEESNCWTWRPSSTELWTYAHEGTCNCFFPFRVRHHHSSPQSVQLCWLVVGLKALFVETLVLLAVNLWEQKTLFLHAQGSGMADCLKHWTPDVELMGWDPCSGCNNLPLAPPPPPLKNENFQFQMKEPPEVELVGFCLQRGAFSPGVQLHMFLSGKQHALVCLIPNHHLTCGINLHDTAIFWRAPVTQYLHLHPSRFCVRVTSPLSPF